MMGNVPQPCLGHTATLSTKRALNRVSGHRHRVLDNMAGDVRQVDPTKNAVNPGHNNLHVVHGSGASGRAAAIREPRGAYPSIP
jgi:hypothetical protein